MPNQEYFFIWGYLKNYWKVQNECFVSILLKKYCIFSSEAKMSLSRGTSRPLQAAVATTTITITALITTTTIPATPAQVKLLVSGSRAEAWVSCRRPQQRQQRQWRQQQLRRQRLKMTSLTTTPTPKRRPQTAEKTILGEAWVGRSETHSDRQHYHRNHSSILYLQVEAFTQITLHY